MNRIWLLISAYMQGASFLSKGKREELKRKKRLWIVALVVLGVTLSAGALLSLLVQNYRELYFLGELLGYPHFTVLMAMLLSWIIVLIFSFTSSLSILYRSRDNMLLLSLPLDVREVVISRLKILYIYTFPFFAFFFLPAAGVYIYYAGWNWTLLISAVLLLVFGPVIPLMVSALLSSVLVRLASSSRYRTALEVVGMVFLLLVIIVIQSFLTRVSVSDAAGHGEIMALLSDQIGLLFTRLIPLNWAAGSMIPGNTWKALLFSAISIVLWYALLGLISRRYQSLLSREASYWAGSRSRSKPAVNRPRSVTGALLQREWDVITSNSTFIMESFAQLLILPILLVVMGITGTIGELGQYRELLFDLPYFELIIFGILLLMAVINSVPATSISREGKRFFLSRSLPVSGLKQVQTKMLFHLLFFFPSFLLYYLLLQLLLPMQWAHLVYAVPGGLVFLALSGMVGLMIDLSRPLLDWTHPQQAMKQNMNVVISMGINALILGVCALAAFLLVRIQFPDLGIGGIIVLLAALLLVLLYPKLRKLAEYRYQTDLL